MKNSLKHSTYEYIKNKIIHCEYEPGMFLNEELLCSEIGVSRTPGPRRLKPSGTGRADQYLTQKRNYDLQLIH